MFKWIALILLSSLSMLPAFAESPSFAVPLVLVEVDPESENLHLYLTDANGVDLDLSVVGEADTLLLNEQVPSDAQKVLIKEALTDLQRQGPIAPQASQAVDYLIKLLN